MKTRIFVIILIGIFAKVEISKSGQPGHGFIDTLIVTEDSSKINAHLYDSPSTSEVPLIILVNKFGQRSRYSYEVLIAFEERFCWGKKRAIPNCPHFVEFDIEEKGKSIHKVEAIVKHVKKVINESDKVPLSEEKSLDVSLKINDRFNSPTRIDTTRIYILGVAEGANMAMKVATQIPAISKVVAVSPIKVSGNNEIDDNVKNFLGKVLIITDIRDSIAGEFAKQLTSIDGVRIESMQFLPDDKAFDIIYNNWEKGSPEESMNYLIDWLLDVKRSE